MAVEDDSVTPAGGGHAAAHFLSVEGGSRCLLGGTSGKSTSKESVPSSPTALGKKSALKKTRVTEEKTKCSEEWLVAFREMAQARQVQIGDEILEECARLAQQLAPMVKELCEKSAKAGLGDGAETRRSLSQMLFDGVEKQEATDHLESLQQAAKSRKGTTVLRLAEDSLREKEKRQLQPQRSLVCPLDLDHDYDDDEGDESGPIMTTKYSYKKAAPAKPSIPPTEASSGAEPHPLFEAMVEMQGEVTCLQEALEGCEEDIFQIPLDPANSIPAPLFYAVGRLKSPGVVKLLLESKASPLVRSYTKWEIFEKGMTPLQAVLKNKSIGDRRMEAIRDLLKRSEESSGEEVAKKQSETRKRAMSFSGQLQLPATSTEQLSSLGMRSEPLDMVSEDCGKFVQKSVDAATFNRLRRRHSVGGVRRVNSLGRRPSMCRSPIIFCKHVEGHPSQMYEMGEQIGSGTFGTVWQAKHTQTGQLHAVKSCPKKLIPSDELWAEIEIMKQLDHPHIMRLYYTFEDDLCIFIASELCEGGELFNAMIAAGTFNEHTAAQLFKQIMSAVSYIHMNMICHRDLKPENFLISKNCAIQDGKVKLIDFGTAKRFDLGPLTTKVCTVHYVAPEVLKKRMEPYTEKVDVWSAGVVLFVMLAGVPPFHDDDDLELMKKVKKGKWSFTPEKAWSKVSALGKELVSKMLTKEVDSRPHSAEVLASPWFRQEVIPAHTKVDEHNLAQMRTFVAQSRLKKVALQVIARQISDDTIEKLRQIFLSLDDDNSGTLSVEEIDEALERLEVEEPIRVEMRRLMHEIDVDGSGTVNYTEFIAANISKKQYLQEQVCKAAFHIFDVNGDGFICKDDLATLLKSGHQEDGFAGISVDEISEIMKEVDQNGDGHMSFEEFMALMADRKEAPKEQEDTPPGT